MTGKPQVCTVADCTAKPTARRMCHKHYQAAWKAGDLDQHVKLPPRPKKRTRCPKDHKHADASTCFIQHQCRCTPCVDAHNARERNRTKQKAYGRFDSGLVDATPVREHILALSEYGIGYRRVAELAGVGVTGVRTLVWGRQDPGPRFGEIPKRVTREKAEKILTVEAKVENLGARQPVPALGAHRRIQALVTRGWSLSKIARRLDMNISNFWKVVRSDRIGAGLHLRVAALYEELWDQTPPHDEWHDAAAYTRTLNYAKRKGWLPPLAWDDIDTDPQPEIVKEGRATADEVLDDVAFLLDAGESPEQVAVIVGRKVGTLAKLAERNGRRDIANMFGSLERRVAA